MNKYTMSKVLLHIVPILDYFLYKVYIYKGQSKEHPIIEWSGGKNKIQQNQNLSFLNYKIYIHFSIS